MLHDEGAFLYHAVAECHRAITRADRQRWGVMQGAVGIVLREIGIPLEYL